MAVLDNLLISTYLCFWFGFLVAKVHWLLFLDTHTYSRLPLCFLRFWWVGNCKVAGIHCSFLALYNDCVKGHSGWGRVGLGAIAREVREEAASERDKTIRAESRAAQKIPLSVSLRTLFQSALLIRLCVWVFCFPIGECFLNNNIYSI